MVTKLLFADACWVYDVCLMKSRRRYRNDLSAERVRSLLAYDPVTGVFRWKVRPAQHVALGSVAGHVDTQRGYRLIVIDGIKYRAHRLAVLWMTGAWPSQHVDHENGDHDDNRWAKIREATPSQNIANAKLYKNNKTGFKGVTVRATTGRFQAHIGIGGKRKHLGFFDTAEEAGAAYAAAANSLFGRFSRPA